MGVHCKIIVQNPREGVYRPGDTVNGVLEYAIDEPTEYKDITVSLIGKGKFHVSKGSGKNKRHYYGKEEYINITINVLNKRPGETVTLPFGNYTFPFEFRLPGDIPSSYSNNSNYVSGYAGQYSITYTIKAQFEKPSLFSFKTSCEKELVIYGYVNPVAPDGPIIAGIEKGITYLNPLSLLSDRKEVIHLKSTLEKSYLTPGEAAHLSYEIHNDTDIDVNAITTHLQQRLTLTSNDLSHTYNRYVKGCTAKTQPISNNTKTYIKVSLPTIPEVYSIQHSKIINVEYFVKVTVDVPFPHINASVEIPIAIGERQGQSSSMNVLEFNDYEDDFDPPTYKEAVNYDKPFYEV